MRKYTTATYPYIQIAQCTACSAGDYFFFLNCAYRLSVVNVGNNDDAAAADYDEVDVGVSTKNMASTLHIYTQIFTLTNPFIYTVENLTYKFLVFYNLCAI